MKKPTAAEMNRRRERVEAARVLIVGSLGTLVGIAVVVFLIRIFA